MIELSSKLIPIHLRMVGLIAMSLVVIMASAVLPYDTAAAATCGGSIVTSTTTITDTNGTHSVIVVKFDRGGRTPTKIRFLNGRTNSYEDVPNANYGVRYDAPLKSVNNIYYYGVSTRWIYGDSGHYFYWQNTWRWLVYYAC